MQLHHGQSCFPMICLWGCRISGTHPARPYGGATTSSDTLDAALNSFTQLGLRCHQAWLHSGAASHLTEFAGVEKECNCTMANHIYIYIWIFVHGQ